MNLSEDSSMNRREDVRMKSQRRGQAPRIWKFPNTVRGTQWLPIPVL
jgi:hypothetical protein